MSRADARILCGLRRPLSGTELVAMGRGSSPDEFSDEVCVSADSRRRWCTCARSDLGYECVAKCGWWPVTAHDRDLALLGNGAGWELSINSTRGDMSRCSQSIGGATRMLAPAPSAELAGR